jgi:hypothetical protein
MTSECSINQQRIPPSLAGDLSAEEQQSLDTHLLACPSCHAELKRYAETLDLLQSASDEPVPHHFFVYPQERASSPWQPFRKMTPRWQIATACFAGVLVLLVAANLSRLQIRQDQDKWSLSFGSGGAMSPSDMAALKAEILRAADVRDREIVFGYMQDLRAEIAGTRADLSQQQQVQLVSALDRLESRFNVRLNATSEELKAANQSTAMNLYQTVSQQREQDIGAVNARLDKTAENFDVKTRQTDEILETLLQIANLNLKQPGDQK